MFFGVGRVGRQIAAKTRPMTDGGGYTSPIVDMDFTSGVLDPRITFTRATAPGTYFDSTGVMRNAGYNQIRNSTMQGAIVGAPGTFPTNWVLTNQATGTNTAVVATGYENGLPFIDIQFFGTASITGNILVAADSTTQIVAATGQTWNGSVYVKLVAGTQTVPMQTAISARLAGGVFASDYTQNFTLTNTLQRYAARANPIGIASVAFIQPKALVLIVNSGQTIDCTVRIAAPQIEQTLDPGSYAPTTTAASGAPRFDYDPVTLAPRGLLIEEARTNLALQSADLSQAVWQKTNAVVGPPVVTANQIVAPDGTLTAARVDLPAVSGAGAVSQVTQSITATANPYTWSIYLRGVVGGEQLYLWSQLAGVFNSRTLVTLTTAWQRFSLTTPTLTAASYGFYLGVDTRDTGNQTAKPIQSFYAWGGQVEQGTFPTSYIPTAGSTVTRAVDVATMPPIPGRNTSGETWNAEFMMMYQTTNVLNQRIISSPVNQATPISVATQTRTSGGYDQAAGVNTVAPNLYAIGGVSKGVLTWATPNTGRYCLNAGPIMQSTLMTNGFAQITAVKFGGDSNPTDQLTGYIRRFRYWPRVLSNDEMQAVTT